MLRDLWRRVYDRTGFQGKTVWNWLELLIIPVALAAAGLWFSHVQSTNEQTRIANNEYETALQTYLDRMSELLIEKNLRDSDPSDPVRTVAHARTLSIFQNVDGRRKGTILKFLYEAELINNNNTIIPLDGADLRNTDLHGAYLSTGAIRFSVEDKDILYGPNLERVDLTDADLSGAYLNEIDLDESNLTGANLDDAYLSYANLRGVTVTQEQLLTCRTLRGATLPDGTKVPNDRDFPDGWK